MDPITALSLGRIALGTVSLTRPELAGRLLGLDVGANAQLPFMTRMFASREIAVGAATLVARGSVRRRLVLAGIGIDAADAAAGYVGGQDGSLPRRTSAVMLAVPGGAVLAGLAAAAADLRRRRTRESAHQ